MHHFKKFKNNALIALLTLGQIGLTNGEKVSPVDLLTDYRKTPMSIDRFPVKLSWNLPNEAKFLQSKYQIQSAKTKEDLKNKNFQWDSGIVESDQSSLVEIGQSLKESFQTVWWQVRVQSTAGEWTEWSEPTFFETGILNAADWSGSKWIGDDRKHMEAQEAPSAYLGDWVQPDSNKKVKRIFKNVDLPKKQIVRAMAYWATSKFVNNVGVIPNHASVKKDIPKFNYSRVARGDYHSFFDMAFLLKPGQTNSIDLILLKGANDFAASVGIHIVYGDGTEQVVKSDDSWEVEYFDDKKLGKVNVVEEYGGSKYGKVRQFEMKDLAPVWMHKPLTVEKEVSSARLYLSALGMGKSYLNGEPVDEELLGVPQTDYEEFAYYSVHDLTDKLNSGENALAVMLHPGYFHPTGIFDDFRWSYGKPGLKALVRIQYTDGSSETIVSDESWKWKENHITASNIYRGSKVDFRLLEDSWKGTKLNAEWKPATVLPPLSPKLVGMDVNPVRKGPKELTPIKSWQTDKKTWLFDLGETVHGWVKFPVNESEGTVVRIRYTEYAKDGVIENVPRSHWHCHKVIQNDEIIANGKSQTFEPIFTPKSFRYFEISGVSKKPENLTGYTIHTDTEPLTTFESSDKILNRIYENGMRTWRNYMVHMLNDMPRERCLWGAESIYTEVPATLTYDLGPNNRLMNTLWNTGVMTPEGIPGNIAVGKRLTNRTQGYIWSSTPIFLASIMYDHYGDLEPAKAHYEKLKHIIRYPETTGARNGTIPTPNTLEDHAPIFSVKRKHAIRGGLLTSMVYYEALNRFAELANALGKSDDATHSLNHAKKVKETVHSFYDFSKSTFGNDTADSLALAYGIFDDPAEHKKLAASMASYSQKNGNQFGGGFLTYELYPQMAEYGYIDDAVKMLRNTTPAGPANSIVKYDATTFYETYWSDHFNQSKVGLNFVAFTHSIGWMLTDLAGIDYKTPKGQRVHVTLEPRFTQELDFAKGSVKTPSGKVTSHWKRANKTVAWKVSIPANVDAEISSELFNAKKVLFEGKPYTQKNIRTEKAGKTSTIFLNPGEWTFTY